MADTSIPADESKCKHIGPYLDHEMKVGKASTELVTSIPAREKKCETIATNLTFDESKCKDIHVPYLDSDESKCKDIHVPYLDSDESECKDIHVAYLDSEESKCKDIHVAYLDSDESKCKDIHVPYLDSDESKCKDIHVPYLDSDESKCKDIHAPYLDSDENKCKDIAPYLDHAMKDDKPSTESGTCEEVVQPDGGWGWLVCATSMLSYAIVAGFINAVSVVHVAMLKNFGDEDSSISFKTSWVSTTMLATAFLMCSVAGVLSDRFGIRRVAFVGGFCAFVGTLSSAFVQDLMLLYFTFGVLTGVGFAFHLSLSLVILGHYFKKYLGLVNALVTFGGGLFSMGYSQVLPLMFDNIGLKNTLFALSGINFMLMVNALTWIPLLTRQHNKTSASEGKTVEVNDVRIEKPAGKDTHTPSKHGTTDAERNKIIPENTEDVLQNVGSCCLQEKQSVWTNSLTSNALSHRRVQILTVDSQQDSLSSHSDKGDRDQIHTDTFSADLHPSDPPVSLGLRQDLNSEMDEENETVAVVGETNVHGDSEAGSKGCCGGENTLLNPRIWSNRQYVLWVAGGTVAFFGYLVGTFHMVKFCEDRFPDSDSSLLPLSYGGATAVARLAILPFADRAVFRRHYMSINQAAFIGMGVATSCIPFATSFPPLVIIACVLGIGDGLFFLLIGPIVVKLVGVADSSQAVGFFFGFISLPFAFGPSLAGLMYDYMGTYDMAYHVFGVPLIIGGALICCVSCVPASKSSPGRTCCCPC